MVLTPIFSFQLSFNITSLSMIQLYHHLEIIAIVFFKHLNLFYLLLKDREEEPPYQKRKEEMR